MHYIIFLIVLLFFNSTWMYSGNSTDNKGLEGADVSGMGFIENKGQVRDVDGNERKEILYTGDCKEGKFFIKKTGISYLLSHDKSDTEVDAHVDNFNNEPIVSNYALLLHRVDVDFLGASPKANVNSTNKNNFILNYYHGVTSVEKIFSYNTLEVQNMYNGIDVQYKKQSHGFKYDIIVKPGANVDDIALKYSGADKLELVAGALKVHTALGIIGEWMPKVYQVINGKVFDVNASYILLEDESVVKFNIAAYDKSQPLVIDPWVTFFGSVRDDIPGAITTDAAGNLIVTGETNGVFSFRTFPTTVGAFQFVSSGAQDAFIAKFSSTGNLIWASYFGGNDIDIGVGVAVDKTTNAIYFSGETSSANFPVTAGSFQTSPTTPAGPVSTKEAFLVKMDANGNRLWATYFGGEKNDEHVRVEVDALGNVFTSGTTQSANFPVTAGAFQNTLRSLSDCFLIKWDGLGNMLWSTFYGGNNRDDGKVGLASDLAGNIYLTGRTLSTDIPLAAASTFQPAHGGGFADGFIVKFNSLGTPLWASYCGGSSSDRVNDVTTDQSMNVVIVGDTRSANFKTTVGAYQTTFGSSGDNEDAFLVKFNSLGTCLWSTYMGKTGRDYACGVAIDKDGNIHISGDTYKDDFPTTSCAYQTEYAGVEDNFFARFSPSGQLICSSLIGGSGPNHDEIAFAGVAVDDGWVYIAAYTADNNYPITQGAFQTRNGGGGKMDVVLVQMCALTCGINESTIDFSSSKQQVCKGESITFNSIVNACDLSETKYEWSFPGAIPSVSTSTNPVVAYHTGGTFSVKLKIVSPCDEDSTTKNLYISVSDPLTSIAVTNLICHGDSSGTAIASTTGGTSPYSYSWSLVPAQTGSLVSGLSAGNYHVQSLDSLGCVSTATFTVTQPLPVSVVASPSQNACIGQAVTLTSSAAGGAGGYTFTWLPMGPVVNVSSATVLTLTITASDSNGCASAPQFVNVTGNPLPEVSFNADVKEGCGPLCVNFSETTTGNSLLWNFGDGSSSTLNKPNHCYENPGKYNVSLFVTDANGCTNSVNVNDYIYVYPSPVAAYDASPLIVSNLNPEVKFKDKSTGAITWLWKFGDESGFTSTHQHPAYNYENEGEYISELWVVNEFGCTDSASALIKVKQEAAIYIPNTFTPNGDGLNDLFFPVMSGVLSEDYVFYIYNRWGELIFKTHDPSKAWDGRVNNVDVQQDVYVWKLFVKQTDLKTVSYVGHVNLIR